MTSLAKFKEPYSNLIRNHIVMCHTLLPADLSRPRNLTALSGLVLTTGTAQVNNPRSVQFDSEPAAADHVDSHGLIPFGLGLMHL